MTVKERMDELIKNGAAITVAAPGGRRTLTLLLAGVVWLQRPLMLRWCAVFPEHQGHIHETYYNNVRLVADGRDIGFYLEDELVLYVCPYEESGEDINAYRDTFIAWQAGLREYNNEAQFDDFLKTA